MNVDELIVRLKKFNGKLLVVAYNGSDPSDLCEVEHVEAEERFFHAAKGSGYGDSLVVCLT